jgi:hypothetical protein
VSFVFFPLSFYRLYCSPFSTSNWLPTGIIIHDDCHCKEKACRVERTAGSSRPGPGQIRRYSSSQENCSGFQRTTSERQSRDCDRYSSYPIIPEFQNLTPATGTNSPLGIGRASAHQYAQNGARAVYICDYNDANLETHKRELASLYPDVDVHTRCFDAADEEAVKAVVDEAMKAYGRLDIFFANAGIVGQPKMFTEIAADEFLATLRTNVVR